MAPIALDDAQQALLELLRLLDAAAYDFTTVTPASHWRVLDREEDRVAEDLRDLLGWSLAGPDGFAGAVRALLDRAGAVAPDERGWRSRLRVSRVAGRLFLHSAFPPRARDSVFLGPDTYRFVRFIRQQIGDTGGLKRVADIGAGAGVGGIVAAGLAGAASLELTDVNPAALRLAAVNAAHAGVEGRLVECRGLEGVEGGLDLVVANPPFMNGASGRTYSAGGDMHGGQMSLDWSREAVDKLARGGRLLLYTGSAILRGGEDRMRAGLEGIAAKAGCTLAYEEIDPDIFGDVLSQDAYAEVERIAAVGAVLTRG
ncbi:MAG TPA: methyltransferase [Caulobacteraceae bacterium]|nr:methyltransferase [Caulobacteraceae bacterium]